MASIILKTGNGIEFQISPEDEVYVTAQSWTAFRFKNKQGKVYVYVGRRPSGGTENTPKVYLHRAILARMYSEQVVRGMVCDHVNGDTLDNRRENLRTTTSGINRFNSGPNADSTSGHRGVHWNSATKKWVARLRFNKREKFLGYYETVEEASEVCRKAAEAYIGEHAPMHRRE